MEEELQGKVVGVEGMDDTNETVCSHSRTEVHMDSHRLWQHALGLHRDRHGLSGEMGK